MKAIYKFLCAAAVVMTGVSCSDDNLSDLNLKGDCSIEALELDGTFTGSINATTRTVKVKVPVDFTDKSQMKVTKLDISSGAKANISKDQTVDFTEAKNLHITNGDLFLDWTINVKNDEAKIFSFILNDTYKASVNQAEHVITAFLPGTVDVTALVPTIEFSEDATVTPAPGVPTDFSEPVVYTVTDNTATEQYTVKVEVVSKPTAIFLGSAKAATMDELVGEEREACKWMLSNVPNSLFASWDDLKAGNVDLSECQVIFWHWQHEPSQTLGDFESGATSTAMSCKNILNEYYQNGGAFVLGRAAINFAAELGAVKDQLCANNCWGASDDGGEIIGGSWDFPAKDESSWLWQGIVGGFPVKTLDADYQISNCVSQWGKWMFNDGDFALWEDLTGCKVLAHGWDLAVTIWECPAANGTFGKGGIVCFGSGCYDWYSPNPYTENYHKNVGIITGNAFNHLMGK